MSYEEVGNARTAIGSALIYHGIAKVSTLGQLFVVFFLFLWNSSFYSSVIRMQFSRSTPCRGVKYGHACMC